MDVVPANAHYWDVDPFPATVKDGDVYGRGTLDMKTLGIPHGGGAGKHLARVRER